jgi:hypothetical protein
MCCFGELRTNIELSLIQCLLLYFILIYIKITTIDVKTFQNQAI